MTAQFTKTSTVPLTGSISQTESVGFYTTPMVPDTPLALRLAEQLERTEWGEDCEFDAAAAELRRLHELYEQARDKAVRMIEANDQWAAKTQWVQDTVQPEELGMHRADVLKQRLDRLHAENEALKKERDTAELMSLAIKARDEALLRQALEALEWVEPSGTTGFGGVTARSSAITALRARLENKA